MVLAFTEACVFSHVTVNPQFSAMANWSEGHPCVKIQGDAVCTKSSGRILTGI